MSSFSASIFAAYILPSPKPIILISFTSSLQQCHYILKFVITFISQYQSALRNPAAASVGFTSTSSRFSAADHKASFGPSPGSYDPSSTMIDEMNKKLVSRTGVFGSTTRRFATIGSSNAVEEAAPPPSQVLDT